MISPPVPACLQLPEIEDLCLPLGGQAHGGGQPLPGAPASQRSDGPENQRSA